MGVSYQYYCYAGFEHRYCFAHNSGQQCYSAADSCLEQDRLWKGTATDSTGRGVARLWHASLCDSISAGLRPALAN